MEASDTNYNIRRANGKDIPELMKLSKEFCEGRFQLDDAKLQDTCAYLVFGGGEVFVALFEDKIVGIMACIIMPEQLLFKDKVIASEPFWFVHPDHRKTGLGILLLRRYQSWAKDLGCDGVQCGSLDENTAKILEAVGFKEISRTHMKWLNHDRQSEIV